MSSANVPSDDVPQPVYLTTPIYYVNDAPHIGHGYTTVIADAVARWRRLAGHETLFLTGTDEHGLKVQRAAEAHGATPLAWADRTSQKFLDAWQVLNISNDDFIRTTEGRHRRAVETFLLTVYNRGDIELDSYEGLYCVGCESYYALEDSLAGQCPVHKRPLELMKEDNYFFRLSRYEARLLEYYACRPDFVRPVNKRNEALGLIRSGLRDFSISRTSVTWGIPIPWDARHVTYVWFDALVNYVTAAGYGSDAERFAKWWPVSHHLIGKDILRFHCVYWPAMLMAAGLEPPNQISVHGYLLVGGEKMSKTALNQVSPLDLAADFGVDALRYHLLRDQPFGPDGDFSYEGIEARYNADLANTLGNLVARLTTLVSRKCGGVVPAPRAHGPMATLAGEVVTKAAEAWQRVAPSEALEAAWRLLREANVTLEAAEPWKLAAGLAVDGVLGDCVEAVRIAVLLACPAIPTGAASVWGRLGIPFSPTSKPLADTIGWGAVGAGGTVALGRPLFPRRRTPAASGLVT